jgi:hypothetical protein
MVAFTQHHYTIKHSVSASWFKLLCKIHPGVDIEVTLNDGSKHKGDMTCAYLSSLPVSSTYDIVTERFWDQYSTIQVMPAYTKPVIEDWETITRLEWQMAAKIDGWIEAELSRGSLEYGMIGTKLNADHFTQVMKAFRWIQKNDKITRVFICHASEKIYFVVKDRYTIVVSCRIVETGYLPVLDLKDGFVGGTFARSEQDYKAWNTQFKAWQLCLEQDAETNWQKPILVQE